MRAGIGVARMAVSKRVQDTKREGSSGQLVSYARPGSMLLAPCWLRMAMKELTADHRDKQCACGYEQRSYWRSPSVIRG